MNDHKILTYWFGDITSQTELSFTHQSVKKWNDKSSEVDRYITHNFGRLYDDAVKRLVDGWRPRDLRSCLATIILIDQFPRHIYRDDPRMYGTDRQAIILTKNALAAYNHETELNLAERMFLYMPLMHSENLADEQSMLTLFKTLSDDAAQNSPQNTEFFKMTYGFAARHFEIVQRFGRFPHRNKILGRVSSEEELAFLKEPNSSF